MKVLVSAFMRLNSERVPRKMLATVGGRTLAEIAIEKLLHLKHRYGDRIEVAASICPADTNLISIAEQMRCPVLARSLSSRDGESHDLIYGELRAPLIEKQAQRLVVVNPCQPFLSLETIASYVNDELESPHSFRFSRAMVFRLRGWVWDQDGALIHGGGMPNSKVNPAYHVLTHSLYSYPSGILGAPSQMDFRHFKTTAPSAEFIDIDTPEDLHFARCYAIGLGAITREPLMGS